MLFGESFKLKNSNKKIAIGIPHSIILLFIDTKHTKTILQIIIAINK